MQSFIIGTTVTAAVLCGWPGAAYAQERDEFAQALDAFAVQAMQRLEAVPGMAVAVVDDHGVVHTAGYGLADVRTQAPVTPQTRFYVASATKAFTALSLAAMDARGEVDIDAPLSSWSPPSGVPDNLAAQVTLTDLLSHRSGLSNDAIAFRLAFSGDWTVQGLWDLTSQTRPNTEAPHGVFDYTNTGYNLATVLIQRRWGRDWRDLVQQEVLDPLGMTQTTAWIDAARLVPGGVAAGHFGRLPHQPEPSYLQKTDATMHSAGGLISTADDMALWLQAQINDGVVNGRRVLPQGLIASTHVSRVEQSSTFGPYERTGYGLGWQIGRYGEDVLIHHFGSFSGSRTHVSFMPERRLGVAVMINEDGFGGGLADLIANYAYDWFAGMPDIEAVYDARLAELVALRDRRREGIAAALQARAERPRTLALADEAYVGDYVSAAYGVMTVRQAEGGLELAIGVQHAMAQAGSEPETVRVELTPFAGQLVTFIHDSQGRPQSLTYDGQTFVRR